MAVGCVILEDKGTAVWTWIVQQKLTCHNNWSSVGDAVCGGYGRLGSGVLLEEIQHWTQKTVQGTSHGGYTTHKPKAEDQPPYCREGETGSSLGNEKQVSLVNTDLKANAIVPEDPAQAVKGKEPGLALQGPSVHHTHPSKPMTPNWDPVTVEQCSSFRWRRHRLGKLAY